MTLRTILVASSAAVLWSAAPAAAADLAQLSCPLATLSAPDRERLADHARRQGDYDEAPMQVFSRSVAACAGRHGWSAETGRQAFVHNLASVAAAETRRSLEQRGVPVATIERALLAEPAVVAASRSDAAVDEISAFYERLPADLRASVETGGASVAELLGAYLLYRAAIETSREDFAAQ